MNPENPAETYNVVLVLCATIHTLYEMAHERRCGIDTEAMQREKRGFRCLLTHMLKTREQCTDKAEIIEFDDCSQTNDLPAKVVQACRPEDMEIE